MDILVSYCEPWDSPLKTSKHHYIERLAQQGHRVLYIEIPVNPLSILRNPKDFINNTLPKIQSGAKEVSHNIWVFTGIFPFPFHQRFGVFDHLVFNTANQFFFYLSLKKVLKKLEFKNIVMLCYYPLLLPMIDRIKPNKLVLHMVDEWQALPGIPKSMGLITIDTLKLADMVIVTSQVLFDRYKKYTKKIHLLRHGTDLKLFTPLLYRKIKKSSFFEKFKGVNIGYYGALHKLDYLLIESVAMKNPGWSFIFLGPLTGSQGLGKLMPKLSKNVYFLDTMPWDKLPEFLAGIDVFWMPFVSNELTHAMCPIKIFEVLSSGTPLVSSDLYEIHLVGGNYINYATNPETHSQELRSALSSDNFQERKSRSSYVEKYDWSARMKSFSEYLFGNNS
jgi:glycosyltransferase involved in cell wall biosynthesis